MVTIIFFQKLQPNFTQQPFSNKKLNSFLYKLGYRVFLIFIDIVMDIFQTCKSLYVKQPVHNVLFYLR